MLGFIYPDDEVEVIPRFVPTTALAPPRPGRRGLYTVDAHHGNVLFCDEGVVWEDPSAHREFVVWDPITRSEWTVPMPESSGRSWTAAVHCGAAGCEHLDCHGHPFLVAYVYIDDDKVNFSARVYSSEAAAWSGKNSAEHRHAQIGQEAFVNNIFDPYKVLVGNVLYFNLDIHEMIIQYDLASRELSMIDPPDVNTGDILLMTAEHGGLGFAVRRQQGSSIELWSMEVDAHQGVEWVQSRVINLETLLPLSALSRRTRIVMIGFAEGVGLILISTEFGVFTLELKSGQVRKVCSSEMIRGHVIPYMSFYHPGHARGILPPDHEDAAVHPPT